MTIHASPCDGLVARKEISMQLYSFGLFDQPIVVVEGPDGLDMSSLQREFILDSPSRNYVEQRELFIAGLCRMYGCRRRTIIENSWLL